MLYSKVVRHGSCPCLELDNGGARTCTLVALNCIHTIYRLLHEKSPVIKTLFSVEGITTIVDVVDDASLLSLASMTALMETSRFRDELAHRLVESDKSGVRGVGAYLYECFDAPNQEGSVTSLVLSGTSQSMACIKFRLAAENIYLVMDPHIRTSHPDGPGLLLSRDLAEIVHYIDNALQNGSQIDSKQDKIDVASVTIHAIQPLVQVRKLDEADFAIPPYHDLTPLHSQCKGTLKESSKIVTDANTLTPSSPSSSSSSSSSSPSPSPSSFPFPSPSSSSSSSPQSSSFQEKMPGTWIWEDELRLQLQKEEHSDSTLDNTSPNTKLGWLSATLESMQNGGTNTLDITNDDLNSSVLLSWDHQLALHLQEEELDRARSLDLIHYPGRDTDGMTPRRNAQEHVDFLEEIVRRRNGTTTLSTLDLPPPDPISRSTECGICHEMHPISDVTDLLGCSHSYCNECLQQLVRSKLQDGRYPIFCPECHVDRSRSVKTQIDQGVIEKLRLEKSLMDRLSELQLISHSVVLHCPRCHNGISVDRESLLRDNIVICPLSGCGQHWCKSCNKQVASSATKHRCKHVNIDRLMRRKGWKYCPGCQTPIQKESGCNHITCGAPGCNVHFCYKCCVLIIDTTNGGDVGTAVTEHYTACQLFEKRFKCTIQ